MCKVSCRWLAGQRRRRADWVGGTEGGEELTHMFKYISYTEDAEPKLRSVKVSDISTALRKPFISLQHSSHVEIRNKRFKVRKHSSSLHSAAQTTTTSSSGSSGGSSSLTWNTQTFRQTDRRACCQTDRQTDMQAFTQTDMEAFRQTDMQAVRQTDRKTESPSYKQTWRLSDRQTDRNVGRQAGRQTYSKQADILQIFGLNICIVLLLRRKVLESLIIHDQV